MKDVYVAACLALDHPDADPLWTAAIVACVDAIQRITAKPEEQERIDKELTRLRAIARASGRLKE